MFSFLGFYGKLCVFSLDRGIGECGIEKKKKKRERLCRMMRKKKSRDKIKIAKRLV